MKDNLKEIFHLLSTINDKYDKTCMISRVNVAGRWRERVGP